MTPGPKPRRLQHQGGREGRRGKERGEVGILLKGKQRKARREEGMNRR